VVNGCQTSHVLFKHRGQLSDEMYLTIKVIETTDIDLYGRIIATTNSQSQVTKEAFATIKPYHKTLEDFFNAMRGSGYEFYYERRPHQFDEQEEIRQNTIVSAPTLIKCFVSVVMEEPHKVHYYYGRLLEEYNRNKTNEIFSESDYPGLYFAAFAIVAKVRGAIGKQSRLNDWIYQLGMLVKRQIAPELRKGLALRDQKFLQLLERIEDGFPAAFKRAVEVLDGAHLHRDENRLPDVTARLLKGLQSGSHVLSTSKRNTEESRFRLADGRYVGVVNSVDPAAKTALVQYGPFAVTSRLGADGASWAKAGARVRFSVKGTSVELVEAVL
jgi:AIPR protein